MPKKKFEPVTIPASEFDTLIQQFKLSRREVGEALGYSVSQVRAKQMSKVGLDDTDWEKFLAFLDGIVARRLQIARRIRTVKTALRDLDADS